jgi:hypothetical protein
MSIQLGNLGEWAAAGFAGAALIISARTLRLQREDQHLKLVLEQQAQARLVNAWAWQDGGNMVLEVANDSDQPITQVRARPAGWGYDHDDAWLFDEPVVAPGGHPTREFPLHKGEIRSETELEFYEQRASSGSGPAQASSSRPWTTTPRSRGGACCGHG